MLTRSMIRTEVRNIVNKMIENVCQSKQTRKVHFSTKPIIKEYYVDRVMKETPQGKIKKYQVMKESEIEWDIDNSQLPRTQSVPLCVIWDMAEKMKHEICFQDWYPISEVDHIPPEYIPEDYLNPNAEDLY